MIDTTSKNQMALLKLPMESFGIHFLQAVKTYIDAPWYVLFTSCVVGAASIVLYSVDYEQGNYPLLGFCVAMTAGALMPLFFVISRVDILLNRSHRLGSFKVMLALGLVVGCVVSPSIYLFMNLFVEQVDWIHPEIVNLVKNDSAYFAKPIWHLAMGSVVLFAIAPVLLVAWPMHIRSGIGFSEAVRFVWRRIEGVQYDWRMVCVGLGAVAIALTWIPLLNLLIPGFVAYLSMEMFGKLLSSHA